MEGFKTPKQKPQQEFYRYRKERMTMLQIVNTVQTAAGEEIIHSPAHYIEGRKIEPIWVIEDWNLNHHLACVLKYISRAGRKHDEVKDLNKAIWYLQRRIKLLEQQQE